MTPDLTLKSDSLMLLSDQLHTDINTILNTDMSCATDYVILCNTEIFFTHVYI